MNAVFSSNACARLTGLCWMAVALLAITEAASARSLLTERPDDARAVYFTAPEFAAHPDGLTDDTAALQAAIDHLQTTTRRGILFIPEGRYRLTGTIFVWSGIRLIGYGAHRPVFVLPQATPGFAGPAHRYLLQFSGERPGDPAATAPNGNASTFYSGLVNINLELGEDNPQAVAIRFHVAQHSLLSHLRIDAGQAFAAIEDAGNLMTNLEVVGGEFGLTTRRTAPTWPFVLMDSTFQDQRIAAVQTADARPVLIRLHILRTPTAVMVEPGHADQVLLRDSILEHISGIALEPGDTASLRSAFAVDHLGCSNVPHLLPANENPSAAAVAAPAEHYLVDSIRMGLALAPDGTEHGIEQHVAVHELGAPPAAAAPDVAALPASSTWMSVKTFGALGDGLTDDTAALRRAIASGKPIYLPQGRYRVTGPLTLRADTVLIGLNPITTQIDLPDRTPAFAGLGERALLTTPLGGRNILSGIGLSTGGINPGASALLWQSGSASLLDDVRFLGGHGTTLPDGRYRPTYNASRTADPDPERRWGSQPPSLIVRSGGGTLRNLWSANTYARGALEVRGTRVPARVYLFSAEHHLAHEVSLDDVHHWSFFALQTEEEKAESEHDLPLRIHASSGLVFGNLTLYRVSRVVVPARQAITISGSRDVTLLNLHSYSGSRFAYDETVELIPRASGFRSRIFNAWRLGSVVEGSKTLAPATLERLRSGFTNLSSLTADLEAGPLYFLDPPAPTLFQWDADRREMRAFPLPDEPLTGPDQAYVVGPGKIALQTFTPNGQRVALFDLSHPTAPLRRIRAVELTGSPDLVLPQAIRPELYTLANLIPPSLKRGFLLAPGLALPEDTTPTLRASTGLTTFRFNKSFLVTSSAEGLTVRMTVTPASASTPRHTESTVFAHRGGDALATGPDGTVYLADGEVVVYAADGAPLGHIHTPERPVSLLVSGSALYIGSRTSLYRIGLPIPSQELIAR